MLACSHTPHSRSGEHVKCAVCGWQIERVPVTKSQDGETRTLALPALNTTEMFVVRTTQAGTVHRGAAAGKEGALRT